MCIIGLYDHSNYVKSATLNYQKAYRMGWIDEAKMREVAKPMLKNQYGQYLLKVIDEMKEEINSRTLAK